MNILHLNTHLDLGGITSHLETLGKALIKKGHRFSILSGGGLKIPALEQNGIRCFSLPIRTKSEIHPKLFAAIPRIARIIREEKFDILHAHTRVTQVLACALSCVTGVPFVSTAHGFYKARLGRKIFPCWGERVVAVSPLVAEELQKTHGIPLTKIRVVNNAVDIEDFEKRLRAHDGRKVRSENGIPDKSFVIGCISRLVRDKGQEYLVQALGLLTQKIPDSFLVLVGDGREKMRLETLVMKLGLNSRVKMISGVVDTTAILSSIDLFVHPATYREGFGLAIAEAILAKKPVVLTNIPALDTLFQEGVDAILVPPKDAEKLAGAIFTIFNDPEKSKGIADRAYEKVSTQYRSERQADEMERVYNEVIARNEVTKQSD